MSPPAAGCDVVDAKGFILQQPSTDQRLFEQAKGILDANWSDAVNDDNFFEICEDVAKDIVYEFHGRVQDEGFDTTLFNNLVNGLLLYGNRKYSKLCH